MQKRKAIWRRGLASLLSAAMLATMVPASALAAETDVPLLADFTFDDAESGFSGGNAVATGTYTLEDSYDTENGKALYLDGSSTNYLTVTDADGGSLLTGKEEITISMDIKPNRTGTNWAFYAAPNSNAQTYPNEHYLGVMQNSGNVTVERYNNSGSRPASPSAAAGSDWSHIDIVITETETILYVNSVKVSTVASNYKLSDILGTSSILQIGKANWGSGEYYQGWMDNLKIYDGALTDDVLISEEAAQAAVAADAAALTLPAEVSEDFTLPSTGANASAITWTVESNDNIVIDTDGYTAKVTRPSNEEGDATVTFTATLSMAGVTTTKDIAVTVLKEFKDQDIVDAVYAELDIATKDDVRGNVYLPEAMTAEGATKQAVITWESSDSSIVTDAEQDGKAAGIVTRPEADTEVTLTATITCGSVSTTKEFVLNVKAAPEELAQTTDYIFAYFTGTEGSVTDEQIYFATSEDGSQWTDMTANGSPVLFSEIGDKGVRDPYLIRSPEGDKFYLIATDLSIYYRGGWGNAAATTTGSTKLVVWESYNLVDWTEPRLVDVAGSIPSAGCAWAPEAMYDANTGNYVVYWATYAPENNANGDGMNMYYATTRDFYTFSEAEIWIDREHSIIDTTMIQVGDKYYRASGDGQITIEESDSIYEGWEIIGTLSEIFDNNGYSGSYLEGPEFFKYNEDDYLTDENGNPVETWGLMCDQYAAGAGYLPFRTTNIADQSTDSWSPATDVNFGSLKKRHGTILPITKEEYNLVMQEIGGFEEEVPVDPSEREVLAQFDFDDDETGFVSANAKATGNYTLTDSYSTISGQALYLDGSSTNFLTVTDENGDSLLTGARQMTISFETKPDRTSANWAFYAAPNNDTQTYPNEHYIGVLINNGTMTVERYNNSGSRPSSPSATVGTDWVRVDIVMDGSNTTIYVDGVQQASMASFYTLADILGDSSILQIGKANWGSGEYYQGWMDNLTILNYALDEETIAANAEDFINAKNGILPELPFTDVAETDWFYEAVYSNYYNELMMGMTDTTFAPYETLSRAQMALILYRIEGQPEVAYSEQFTDVADGQWYTSAVLWAQANGIVTGYGDSRLFGPHDKISREQMAVMMYRYATYKGYDTTATDDLASFTDAADVSGYAEAAVKWAVGSGIITGQSNGTMIAPQGDTLRAECALIIYRFMGNYAK